VQLQGSEAVDANVEAGGRILRFVRHMDLPCPNMQAQSRGGVGWIEGARLAICVVRRGLDGGQAVDANVEAGVREIEIARPNPHLRSSACKRKEWV
jgi:hypothetical protein